jgi:hypothetical protein
MGFQARGYGPSVAHLKFRVALSVAVQKAVLPQPLLTSRLLKANQGQPLEQTAERDIVVPCDGDQIMQLRCEE